jgi:hypothetical protein
MNANYLSRSLFRSTVSDEASSHGAAAAAQGRTCERVTEEMNSIRSQLADLNFDDWENASVLSSSIQQLEAVIRDTDPKFDISPTPRFYACHPVQHLVSLKFKRLEELVFVLRKKIVDAQTYGALASVVDEHGSVDAMKKRMVQLETENARLKQRELRFQRSELLRRRPLVEMEPSFMRCLIVALQNELAAATDQLSVLHAPSEPLLESVTGR